MTITVRPRPLARIAREDVPGEWAVLLGLTPVMRHESYQVACNVEWALNHDAPGITECDEVARAILAEAFPPVQP